MENLTDRGLIITTLLKFKMVE